MKLQEKKSFIIPKKELLESLGIAEEQVEWVYWSSISQELVIEVKNE